MLVAASIAAIALLAAVVAALGPAQGERSEYAWPPATLPLQPASEGWYAPLPLLNRVPSSIEVRLPCGLAPPLRKEGPATVLSTARHPQNAGALRVMLARDSLRISVGRSEIASVPWPTACPLRLEVRDGELRLPTRAVKLRTGTLEDMPVVTGLFSGLDLRAGERPEVVVRTRAYATSPTARQLVAAVLAVALVFAVLLLLGRPGRRLQPVRSLRRRIRAAWRSQNETDAVVVTVLLVWWIVGPAFPDDGWLWVEHLTFSDLGTMAFYFDNWGLNLPIGFWIEWVRHWAIGATSELVFMRVPSLLAVLAWWPLCRWCLREVVPGRAAPVVRWTLAGAFLVGATAWGMTIRLEPFMSLLTVTSLAAMISFARAPRLAPLGITVSAAALAATAHPTGIIASAPLLAGAPEVVRWLRGGERRLP